MTKPTKWLCTQRRLGSAWASAQSDQSLRCTHWVLSCPLSAQRRLWSDWADAQADLSLRWAHTHFVGVVMSWLILYIITYWNVKKELSHGVEKKNNTHSFMVTLRIKQNMWYYGAWRSSKPASEVTSILFCISTFVLSFVFRLNLNVSLHFPDVANWLHVSLVQTFQIYFRLKCRTKWFEKNNLFEKICVFDFSKLALVCRMKMSGAFHTIAEMEWVHSSVTIATRTFKFIP